MSHDTLRRLVSDAYNTQSAGMTVGLPRVKVDASQLRALIAHYDSLIAERDTLRAEVERHAEIIKAWERREKHLLNGWAKADSERDNLRAEVERLRGLLKESSVDVYDAMLWLEVNSTDGKWTDAKRDLMSRINDALATGDDDCDALRALKERQGE